MIEILTQYSTGNPAYDLAIILLVIVGAAYVIMK